jgi:hypothetical protein
MMDYSFGSKGMDAPLTPKERMVQFVTDPKKRLKGVKAPFEQSVNRTLALSHILTDDEYKMMDKGGY